MCVVDTSPINVCLGSSRQRNRFSSLLSPYSTVEKSHSQLLSIQFFHTLQQGNTQILITTKIRVRYEEKVKLNDNLVNMCYFTYSREDWEILGDL